MPLPTRSQSHACHRRWSARRASTGHFRSTASSSTRSEPTADLWDTFYLVVFPTFGEPVPSESLRRSASPGPLDVVPAHWKRPRRVFRCCPAAREHAVNLATTPPVGGRTCSLCSNADHAPSHRTAVSGCVSRHHSPTAAPDPRGQPYPSRAQRCEESTCHEVQAGSFSTG